MYGTTRDEQCRLIAYVFPDCKEGLVLVADGDAANDELELQGYHLSDLGLPATTEEGSGLLEFVGWCEETDDEVLWHGYWERVTVWQLVQLRFGKLPWCAQESIDDE